MERWIERYRAVLFFGCVVAAVAGLAVFEARRRDPVPLTVTAAPTAVQLPPSPTPGPARVYVSGAVLHPDVYSLPAGSIVKDAVAAAGGASAEADLDRLNLAEPVLDGSHVHVPAQGEEGEPAVTTRGPAGRLNVNTADEVALDSLPGIGPELAGRIIEYRQAHGPFAEPDDLLQVSGIGPGAMDKIRDLITTK